MRTGLAGAAVRAEMKEAEVGVGWQEVGVAEQRTIAVKVTNTMAVCQ